MKLDKLDYKILEELDYNARIPQSELAKKLNLSKQNISYRINKLIKNKIIQAFITGINMHKLGYLTYRIYLRININKSKEIIDYFKNLNNTLWVVSLSGMWDLEVVILAKNYIELNNIVKKSKEDLGIYFTKINISTSIFNYQFKRDYLLNKERKLFIPFYYGFEPKKEDLDELDIKILYELSKDCNRSNQEIGKKLKTTYHTIKQRINKMEKLKIIIHHRIFINLEKINRKFYKATITLNNSTKEKEKELYNFCSSFNFIVYLVEVLGDWQLEIEAEVESQNQFNDFLIQLRKKFPDLIQDYQIIQATKEHKIDFFPGNIKLT
ncbi:MAG: Lrp/AsnC family transcriptional regulator [Candidatus Woesearchaeota archaeon]